MISVPERVKDALRDGRLLKEYRFIVQKEIKNITYGNIGEITYADPVLTLYRDYDDKKRCILYAAHDGNEYNISAWVVWPDSHKQPFYFHVPSDVDAYMELTFGTMEVGTRICFTESGNTGDDPLFPVTPTIPAGLVIGVSDTSSIIETVDYIDDFTINNSKLVYESVKIDERMCSGDLLKFGLCEGSSLEFQYFDCPNIRGRQLKCFIDVQTTTHTMVTTGETFEAQKAGTYYLRVPANTPTFDVAQVTQGRTETQSIPTFNQEINWELYIRNVGDTLIVNSSTPLTLQLLLNRKPFGRWDTIPMGYFTVKQCSRQASTGIFKATAYNKLQSDYLDADASILIKNIESDGADPDYVTLKTIQSELLSDYAIEEGQTLMPETISGSDNMTMMGSSPSFKINGSSMTYYGVVFFRRLEVSVSQYKRYKLEIDSYINKIISAVNGLKAAIYRQVQNGSTFWGNFKNTSTYAMTCGFFPYFTNSQFGQYSVKDEMPTSYGSNIIVHGSINNLHYYNGARYLWFDIPTSFKGSTSSSNLVNLVDIWDLPNEYILAADDINVYEVESSSLDMIEINKADPPKTTLRDLLDAYYELKCQFGKLSRTTDLFSGVELSHTALYPADTLYPADNLYPGGISETSFRSWYSKLWTDTVGEQSFRNLIITYRGLDGNNSPADFVLETVVDPQGTTDYIMSTNWLFKNLLWTEQEVQAYANAMVTKMQSIHWFPFEMWAAGLPYIETGDMIEIIVGDETHTSYVLQRQLNGIQNLQDTYINGTLDIF